MLNCCILQRRKRELRTNSENVALKSRNSINYSNVMRSMLDNEEANEQIVDNKLSSSNDNVEQHSVLHQENVIGHDSNKLIEDNDSSSDDEFFETMEEHENDDVVDKTEDHKIQDDSRDTINAIEDSKDDDSNPDEYSSYNDEQVPLGVKEEFHLLLLETNMPMNIPITQVNQSVSY